MNLQPPDDCHLQAKGTNAYNQYAIYPIGSRIRQETPEEDRMTYRPKRCHYKDEDICLKTLNDKNHQASNILFIGQVESV